MFAVPILHFDLHVPGGLDKDNKLCSPGALMPDEARQASCSLRPLLNCLLEQTNTNL